MTSSNVPSLSIIMPAYGVAGMVGEALRSLQRQTMGDWEAIVIDDGTPDDLPGAMQVFAGDPRIRLIQTDNRGVATARNRGVAAARAPLISFLDGDDVYEPDYAASMIQYFSGTSSVDLVTCDARYFGGSERDGQLFSKYCAQSGAFDLESVLMRKFHVFTASMLRRSAFLAVQGFDETLRSAEDFDLWARLLAAGFQGRYLNAPLVQYRRRVGSLSSNGEEMHANVLKVYRKIIDNECAMAGKNAAVEMLEKTNSDRNIIRGKYLIKKGDLRQGMALIPNVQALPLRWMLMIWALKIFPFICKILNHRVRRFEKPLAVSSSL